MNKHLKCGLVLVLTPVLLPLFFASFIASIFISLPFTMLEFMGCIEQLPVVYVMKAWEDLFEKVQDL